MTVLSIRRGLGVVGSDFSDPTNERIIYLSAVGLVLVGVALLVATIMWWRRGRQEHPTLAPLEVMGSRAWEKAPEGDRRRRLDRVRIDGRESSADEPIRPEALDLQALVRSVPQAFDDLREPGVELLPADVLVVPDGVAVNGDDDVVVVEGDAEPSSEVWIVDGAGEAHSEPVSEAVVPVPVVADDADATSFAAERPATEAAVPVEVDPSETSVT